MKRKERKTQRRHYDESFKKDVVEMIVRQGREVKEVADSLGLSEVMVHRWKREYLKSSQPTAGRSTSEAEELLALHKRIKDLELEREILKKALGIFSQKN